METIAEQAGQAVIRWRDDDAESLRFEYPLTEDSVVFDVGGYQGDWAHEIAEKYNPYIYIFEPVLQFCSAIRKRFSDNSKVRTFSFGLLDKMKAETMSVDGDCSSLYAGNGNKAMATFMPLTNFLTALCRKHVDLIKINIEGAEYPLLRHMINTGIITMFENILIQFHVFYPDAEQIRREIRESLEKTHFPTFDYPFVWESWMKC